MLKYLNCNTFAIIFDFIISMTVSLQLQLVLQCSENKPLFCLHIITLEGPMIKSSCCYYKRKPSTCTCSTGALIVL